MQKNERYIERVWVEIDVDKMIESCRVIREEMIPEGIKLMAVLKSDAYGHGAAYLAPILEKECKVDWFAVACLAEAIELRKSGVKNPILILGLTEPRYAQLLAKYTLTQTVGCLRYAEDLSQQAQKSGVTVDCHIKINTGMNRLGFDSVGDETRMMQAVEEILTVSQMKGLHFSGMFSHLYNSLTYDEKSKQECYEQYRRFVSIKEELAKRGFQVGLCHLCNTGGVINFPELSMDMIRVGSLICGLKGVSPGMTQRWNPPLKPIFQLKSRIAMLRTVQPGECVGYSSNYIAKKETKVAIVSCGYTDGYSRKNSNQGVLLVRGTRVPVIGNICMDMMMADVTEVEDVCVGDLVTIYGVDGQEEISCGEAAVYAQTIEPEITTVISRRVPRLYFRDGELIHVEDHLLYGEF